MNEKVFIFYNVFSWWLMFWIFFYIIKLCPVEPFIAGILTVIWDLYVLIFHSDTVIPIETQEQRRVNHFRLLLIFIGHWLPVLTLPAVITKQSIMFLLTLGMIYISLLYLQGLTIFNIYEPDTMSGTKMSTFKDLFELRFNNYFFTTICLAVTFYSGYYLLKYPYKNSLVDKYRYR